MWGWIKIKNENELMKLSYLRVSLFWSEIWNEKWSISCSRSAICTLGLQNWGFNCYEIWCGLGSKLLGEFHLCWVKRNQLDVTCFIIYLFNAQHVLDVNTSILRSLRLICWVISWVVLLWFDVCWCYVVVWLWWCGIRMKCLSLHTDTTPHHPSQTTT